MAFPTPFYPRSGKPSGNLGREHLSSRRRRGLVTRDRGRQVSGTRLWGNPLIYATELRRGAVVMGVAGFVENAIHVLGQVNERLSSARARQAVVWSQATLDDVRLDLESSADSSSLDDLPASWVLNPRWHATVFRVASSRETVLLTVAANAVRVVSQEMDRMLEDRWPVEVVDLLSVQRQRLCLIEDALLGARAEISGVGTLERVGGTPEALRR